MSDAILRPEDYKPIRFSRLSQEQRYLDYGASRMAFCGPRGKPARDYLFRRGLDPGVVADFRIGYVPEDMLETHPFAGRIVMPILDAYDDLLALSVRAIIDGVTPKYWNESFDKSEHLFGLNLAKKWICRRGYSIVVEGQMDVMAMHARGFRNAVGIMGGFLSHVHVQLLRRWAPVTVLLMDQDQAGREHAENAMGVIETFSGRVSFHALAKARQEQESREKGFKFRGKLVVPFFKTDVFRGIMATLPRGIEKSDPAEYLRVQGASGMRWVLRKAFSEAGLPFPEDLQ